MYCAVSGRQDTNTRARVLMYVELLLLYVLRFICNDGCMLHAVPDKSESRFSWAQQEISRMSSIAGSLSCDV